MHDALYRGEADAGALVLVRRMQALEGAEQLVGIAHVEAGAVVAHEEGRLLPVAQQADLDARLLGLGAELPRIADQVLQRRAQQARVGVGLHAVPHRDFDLARRLAALHVRDHLARELADVDVAPRELAARHLGKIQQVLDQLAHALRRGADASEVAARLLGHLLGKVLEQRLAEAVDRAQRRAQVVRHRIAERLELGVGRLQLDGALLDARFQLGVEPQHFFLGAAPLAHLALGFAVRGLEPARRALDFREHAVEALGEQAELVVGELFGAQRIIALFAHLGRDARDGEHRTHQDAVHPAREEIRHPHGEHGDDRRDAEIAQQAVEQLVVGAQVHRAEDFAVADDALEDHQVVALDPDAVAFGQPRKFARRLLVGGKQAPARVVDGRGEDLRAVAQQRKVFPRHLGVVEAERRRGHLPEQLGLRIEIVDPALAIKPQVVGDHCRDGDQQRRQRGGELDREDLAADGLARRGHG